MNVTPFDLVAAKLEAAKRDAIVRLNSDIFASTSAPVLVRVKGWRERLADRAARVVGYFSVLWAALRGKAVHEYDDYDY